MKYLHLLLLSLLFIACEKENEIPPAAPFVPPFASMLDYTTPEVVWMDVLREDSTDCSSMIPIKLGNGDFITSESQNIIRYNGETGERIWVWNDYLPGLDLMYDNAILSGKHLSISGQNGAHQIDVETGETVWAHKPGGYGNTISVFNDLTFIDNALGDIGYPDYSEILMINRAGDVRKTFGFNRITNYSSNLKAPGVYLNNQGDTILIMQNRSGLVSGGYGNKINLYAYNLTDESISWFIEAIDTHGSNIINAPIVDGDRVYFGGKGTMYCIDIPTGEIIWQESHGGTFLATNYQIVGNKLLFNHDHGNIVAVDKHTGIEIWRNEDTNANRFMTVSNGRIYSAAGRYLHITDLETGERLYKYKSPVPGGSFNNTVVVDEENGTMFSTDYYAAICMKLPE